MHTTLAAQLAALELGHLNIAALDRAPCTAPVDADGAEQTLVAVWSDLFALFLRHRARGCSGLSTGWSRRQDRRLST
jgi:hypothetical protein